MNEKEIIILKMKKLHPDFGYTRIAKLTGFSRDLVRYYLDPQGRIKHMKRMRKHRKSAHPLYRKLVYFCATSTKSNHKIIRKIREPFIVLKDALIKFGDKPRCYLTGVLINLNDSSSYSLDHIMPISKGGKSTLENCGL